MARIHSISINNFRGIKKCVLNFYLHNFVCLVGRGDTGKSTILDAISYVLSPNWNLTFYDTDFTNCDIEKPLEIVACLYDLPDAFLDIEKFGLFLNLINDSGKSQWK
jgi:predicted ATP-binding protein involved in virulence